MPWNLADLTERKLRLKVAAHIFHRHKLPIEARDHKGLCEQFGTVWLAVRQV
jgi:hypothetical protein